MTSSPELEAVSVYDGKDFLGTAVEQKCGRWEAVRTDGQSLGLFPSSDAAVNAVLAARQEARP